MARITLPWSMEQDRINQIKANSVHVDDNFNTLLNAVNNKLDRDGSTVPTADLPMGNHKITDLALPVNNGDATNKGYVDDFVASKTQLATKDSVGVVQVGANINVENGIITVPIATTDVAGSVLLGKTDTIANASVRAVRDTVVTNVVPENGEDGVLYLIYEV